MVISFRREDLEVRDKAVSIRIKHNDIFKTMWIPKSLITRLSLERNYIDIPDWFYDKKFDELFL